MTTSLPFLSNTTLSCEEEDSLHIVDIKCLPEWHNVIPQKPTQVTDLSLTIVVLCIGLLTLFSMASTFFCWWHQRRKRLLRETGEIELQKAIAENDDVEVGVAILPQENELELPLTMDADLVPTDADEQRTLISSRALAEVALPSRQGETPSSVKSSTSHSSTKEDVNSSKPASTSRKKKLGGKSKPHRLTLFVTNPSKTSLSRASARSSSRSTHK